jgi:hypothetical protein
MSKKQVLGFLPSDGRRLWWLNVVTAILHAASAAAIFALTEKRAVSPVHIEHANDFRGNESFYGPSTTHVGSATVGYLSGVFLLLAAIDHFTVATILKKTYERQLASSRNYFRWIEYSFSASIMHVMIAMLSGVMSVQLLLAIAGLTVVTMLCGLLQEKVNYRYQGKLDRKTFWPFWIGCVPHLAGWAVIYITFGYSAGDAPPFVWIVMFGLFQTDALFAVNMYLQQSEWWRWKRYVFGEYVFIFLSLVAKSMLAWTNFGGTRSLM